MEKLVALLLHFVLQHSIASSIGYSYYDDYNYEMGDVHYTNECPEGETFITRSEIENLIDHIAENTLEIQEKLMEGYLKIATDVNSKHMEDLSKRPEVVGDNTNHLELLLEKLENYRLNLEELVEETIEKSNNVEDYEKELSRVKIHSQKLFTIIEAYETISAIDTGNEKLFKRCRHKEKQIFLNEHIPSEGTCGSLEDYEAAITEQLIQFQNAYLDQVFDFIENVNKHYHSAVAFHNNQYKKEAMITYKIAIMDLIILRDDYTHLKTDLDNFNTTQISLDIINNIQNTEKLLSELQENVLEHIKRCLSSNDREQEYDSFVSRKLKDRIKRDYGSFKTVDELVEIKINEIRKEIEKNLTDIFSEIDQHLTDPFLLNLYSEKILPKPEDLDDIKRAEEGFKNLKETLAQSSYLKIRNQWQLSKEIRQNTKKAQEDFDSKFPERIAVTEPEDYM